MPRQLLFNATGSLEQGLRARVADPLWLACRQQSLGELRAEDAGSPARFELELELRPLGTRALPPEAAVEAEALRTPGPGRLRIAAELGRAALDWLRARGRTRDADLLRERHPLVPPEDLPPDETLRARLWQRISCDGLALLDDPDTDPDLRDAVATWFEATYLDGEEHWRPEELSYAALLPGQGVELAVDRYLGGTLDWTDWRFVHDDGPEGTILARTVLPARATFPGMPDRRWWSFEDAAVSFADPELSLDRLPQFLAAEFAVVYGDDWFVIPARLPTHHAVRVRRLESVDTFGVRQALAPTGRVDADRGAGGRFGAWDVQDAPLPSDDTGPWRLVLPPRSDVLQGEPVEVVCFLRDEAANLAWAVEERIEGPTGLPRSRQELPTPPDRPPAGQRHERWSWVPATHVPAHWYPLLPVDDATTTTPQVTLRLGRTALPTLQDPPSSRVLQEQGGGLDQALLQGPAFAVQRRWQRARTPDGGAVLWLGRERGPATVQEGPGMRFDEVVPREAGP